MQPVRVAAALLGVALAFGMARSAPAAPSQLQPRQFFPHIARVAPGAPSPAPNLFASVGAGGAVSVTWGSVSRAEGYLLWMSGASNMAGATLVYRGPLTQWGANLGPATYYFRVQAVNDWGATASGIVAVTVRPPPTPTVSPPPPGCAPVPGESYGTLPIVGPPSDRPADQHPDLNLLLRGYVATNAPRMLVDYGGASDAGAPQLPGLFADNRTGSFRTVYRVYDWDWGANRRGPLLSTWPVTLAGLAATTGETVHVPPSGYDIGRGYQVLVLYATEERLTLKYTGEDSVARGYTIHLEQVCVEPRLLALYRQMNAAGRGELPALRGRQAVGRARGPEVGVAVRDAGTFMDPRSRKDWWQGR